MTGIEANLTREGKIRIGQHLEENTIKLNSKHTKIFVAKGDKGNATIGLEIIGDSDKLIGCQGQFTDNNIYLEIKIELEGCCRFDSPTFKLKLFIFDRGIMAFNPLNSLVE